MVVAAELVECPVGDVLAAVVGGASVERRSVIGLCYFASRFRNRKSLSVSFSIFFNSHCQTVKTCQPSLLSRFVTLRSRLRLASIFRLQNCTFEDGAAPRLQRCPCQKHP